MIQLLKGIVRYWDLIVVLVATDLKQRYRRSYLGLFWSVLNPLIFAVALWLVFTHLRTGGDEENYALFLLSGLIVFTFFQQGAQMGMKAVVVYRTISDNVPIPRYIGPIAVVGSNVVNFGFTFLAYVLIALVMGYGLPLSTILLLPVALMATLLTAGLALLLATLFIFFRDIEHLTAVVFRALFFLTPVFYRAEQVGGQFGQLLKLNPVYYPVVATRAVLYTGVSPSLEIWAVGFGAALAVFAAGATLFVALQQRFVYQF